MAFSCIHPGWPPLVGREAVLASYREIFRNPMQDEIELGPETLICSGDDGRIVCIELVGGARLVATNWFRRVDFLNGCSCTTRPVPWLRARPKSERPPLAIDANRGERRLSGFAVLSEFSPGHREALL